MAIPQTPSPLANVVSAKTYNAQWFSGATKEAQITAAIAAAVADGALCVYIPANMLPYNAGLVTFNNNIRMIREIGQSAVYDLKAYGAAGDGATDDTVALTSWLAALSANAGTGYVPGASVKYKQTSGLMITGNNVVIYGDGVASQISATFSNANQFAATGQNDIVIRDIFLTGLGTFDPSNNFYAIKLVTCNRCRVERVRLNLSVGGICGLDCNYTTIQNCYADNVGFGGIVFDSLTAPYTDPGTGVNVGNRVIDCVSINNTGGDSANPVHGYGIVFKAFQRRGEIVNNVTSGNNLQGIYLTDYVQDCLVSGNRSFSNRWDGIALNEGVHDCIVEHNFCRGATDIGAFGGGNGIGLFAHDRAVVNNMIRNNICVANQTYGISCIGGNYNKLEDNYIYQNNNAGIAIIGGNIPASNNNEVRGNTIVDNDHDNTAAQYEQGIALGDGVTGTAGGTIIEGNTIYTTLAANYQTYGVYADSSVGSAANPITIRNNRFGLNKTLPYSLNATPANFLWFGNSRIDLPAVQTLTFGSPAVDLSLMAEVYVLRINIGGPTVPNPTNGFSGGQLIPGMILTFEEFNNNGGAITTTWSAGYHLAGAWVDPASTKTRTISFRCDPTIGWVEIGRAAADIT